MKKFCLLFISLSLLIFTSCSNQVKVRGKIDGFEGVAKLMAEMPGERGLVVLAEQEVKNGDIDLRTDKLLLPARVWVDVGGKRTVEMILDTKDMIWLRGRIQYPNQIEATGSGLMKEYDDLKKKYREKFGDELSSLDNKIMKNQEKEKRTRDDDVLTQHYFIRKFRLLNEQANWTKKLIEGNLDQELSLFLIKDELVDSLDAQKRLFKMIKVENKESNIYKVLESQLK